MRADVRYIEMFIWVLVLCFAALGNVWFVAI